MQSRNDLKTIRFEISCSVTLDLERIVEDPVWESVSRYHDVSQAGQFERALQSYLRHYLKNESVLAEMPSTCGPANIYFARFPSAEEPGMEKDYVHDSKQP
jgi:hypothetical protein